MGIFGTSYPKFIYDHGGAGEVTVNLTHSHFSQLNNDSDTRYIEHESEIDLEREYNKLGMHKVIKFPYLLYKESNPAAFYATLKTYWGAEVTFYLHSDGPQYLKEDGVTDALFILKEIKPIEDELYRDILELTFISKNPVGL